MSKEGKTFGTEPLDRIPLCVPDYGESITGIENALMELREALPNGQRVRTMEAVLALQHHTEMLGRWVARARLRSVQNTSDALRRALMGHLR